MKSFAKNNPSNETEKLIAQLLKKLEKTTNKFMNDQIGKESCVVLSALQSASANYFSSVTKSCALEHLDKSKQLDYIEVVRKDVNDVLDHIKNQIKSVNLN